MNDIDAKGVHIGGGLYHGVFRKVHKADWEPVCHRGEPETFDSEMEAENAAWRALRQHLRSDLVAHRGFVRSDMNKAEADKIFPGGGRVIDVAVRGGRRRAAG